MTAWVKRPASELDFGIDWAPVIGNDVIATSTWTNPDPVGVVVGTGPKAPGKTDTTTTIWFSGGVHGVEYKLVNTIVTLGGRTFEEDVSLRVSSVPVGLPGYSGCDYPIDPACLRETWDKYESEVQQRAVSLASATLYRLTGYRVGGCPVTVRPNPSSGLCAIPAGYSRFAEWEPINWSGTWSNYVCGPWEDPRIISLPAPVGRIDAVKVDGTVLAPTDYAILDDHAVVWIGDGEQPWPCTQDVLVPDTEPGTFSVTYLNSYPPDALAAYAAGLLAMEYASACSGTGKCALPANVRSIVRQGVSYEIPAGSFPEGKTGIRAIDQFIETWNPDGRPPPQIIVPGQSRVHVVR